MIVQTQNPFEQVEKSTEDKTQNTGLNFFGIGLLVVLVVGFLIFKLIKNINGNVSINI